MKAVLVGLIGVAGLCGVASAQNVWMPKVNRTTGVATLVYSPANAPAQQFTYAVMPAPANHFVSGLEFTPDGRLWAAVQGPAGSMQQGLYQVNLGTGALMFAGAPTGLAADEVVTDLAWNPVTHRLVGMATTTTGGLNSRLLSFDIHNGAVVSAANVTSNVTVLHVGLACLPNGEYRLLDVYNDWVSKLVGNQAVMLGNVLSINLAYNQGIGTDYQTGKLWYAAYQQVNPAQGTGAPSLRTVNTTTGVDTLVGSLPGGSNALYTDVTVQPTVNSCPADTTSDHFVDDSDFVSFSSQYDALECGTPAMTGGCSADFNFDGVVDDADFVIFSVAYDALVCL